MGRKPKPGYWQNGTFIHHDAEAEAALPPSKTDKKVSSHEAQDTGEALLTLRADLFARLRTEGHVGERLADELAMLKKITAFEGRRRQSQFVGKLMRTIGDESMDAIKAALEEQRKGSAREANALHAAESWRDRLIADDEALTAFLAEFAQRSSEPDPALRGPEIDAQQLRALVRQARKEASATPQPAESAGLAQRRGKAYREVFQIVRETLA